MKTDKHPVRQIPVPNLPAGTKELSAFDLNKFRFSEGHTVLSPEVLQKAESKN